MNTHWVCVEPQEVPDALVLARAIVGRSPAGHDVHQRYTQDLLLEGVAALYRATGDVALRERLLAAAEARGWTPTSQPAAGVPPFTLLIAEVGRVWDDHAWVAAFVDASLVYRRDIPRSADGLVLHPRAQRWGGGQAVLIDSLQEYARRMAWAGHLGGARAFFDECTEQFALHRQVLRDPRAGLWSQGRAWGADPEGLSPGAWSRGHGWLIRGMVESLRVMPPDDPAAVPLHEMLRELANALLARQADSGMWHASLHLPSNQSPIESSGTAMIAASLLNAIRQGMLPAEPYEVPARRALAALRSCVGPDGIVLHTCPGPGLLRDEHVEAYRGREPFEPDEHHGPGALLLALAAELAAGPP